MGYKTSHGGRIISPLASRKKMYISYSDATVPAKIALTKLSRRTKVLAYGELGILFLSSRACQEPLEIRPRLTLIFPIQFNSIVEILSDNALSNSGINDIRKTMGACTFLPFSLMS